MSVLCRLCPPAIFTLLLMASASRQLFVRSFTAPLAGGRQGSRSLLRRGYSRYRWWHDDHLRLKSQVDDNSQGALQTTANSSSGRNETMDFDFNELNSENQMGALSGNGNMLDPGYSVLSIDENDIDIVVLERKEEEQIVLSDTSELFRQLPFVSMFRGSANYIANHRNTLAVYHIPGDLMDMEDKTVFRDLMNDISLTWLLGMKTVIVVGCRHQIDARVPEREKHYGITVTDEETLRVVKEEAGYVRFEVERQLARSLRSQGAAAGAARDQYDGNVVSGNFFTAQPFGILDGVDYKYSGFVRKIEVDKIEQVHKSRDIVLLTCLGVSPSGEVFNVNSESLAASVAGALGASKIVFFTEKEVGLQHKVRGNRIPHLRVNEGKKLLDLMGVRVHKRGFASVDEKTPEGPAERNMLLKIGWAINALQAGVKRAHIIAPTHGALLQELYTRDGSGTLVSRDLYDGIRQARPEDVSAIHQLITPLIQMGTLIDRPKNVIEENIGQYHVFTRDDHVVACGQLKMFENGFAEIGCLVVNSEYRAQGRGDAMLGYLERMSVQKGASFIFVLSTQTMEWFIERGFDQVHVSMLPPSRQATYNHKRASKIYMKKITSVRDLDASELWWNR